MTRPLEGAAAPAALERRQRRRIPPALTARAVDLIRAGATVREAALACDLKEGSLRLHLAARGIRVRDLRPLRLRRTEATICVSCYVERALYRQLRERAAGRDGGISALVRAALFDYFRRHPAAHPAVWRPIPVPGLDGYEASDQGQVRRIGGDLLRQRERDGYLSVGVRRGGKGVRCEVAPLVAAAFLGPRPPDHVVTFRDRDSTNCAAANLVYATRQEIAAARRPPPA